jgi:phytoene/squalene synthetase
VYPLPFAIQRPWLLMRDLVVNRNQPDLERLRSIRSPERFLWAILPHAARTFSACITMLPSASAKAAAVGYVYCRILDTYEDMAPNPQEGQRLMRQFASRFAKPEVHLQAEAAKDKWIKTSAPLLKGAQPVDLRDQAHMLLVERCDLIDQVFLKLPAASRVAIVHLVRDMAGGMVWAKRVFDQQNGVIHGPSQLRHYCNAVLGNPVAFAMRLMMRRELTSSEHQTAMDVGELVQLANVTRDIEKDLLRGVAYHPSLTPYFFEEHPRVDLSSSSAPAKLNPTPATDAIVRARSQIFDLAMVQAPAYTRMVESIPFRTWSLSRASALLMLEFTDRYYRSCARRIGRPQWPGPASSFRLLLRAFPAFLSKRTTLKRVRQIERNLLAAAQQTEFSDWG